MDKKGVRQGPVVMPWRMEGRVRRLLRYGTYWNIARSQDWHSNAKKKPLYLKDKKRDWDPPHVAAVSSPFQADFAFVSASDRNRAGHGYSPPTWTHRLFSHRPRRCGAHSPAPQSGPLRKTETYGYRWEGPSHPVDRDGRISSSPVSPI